MDDALGRVNDSAHRVELACLGFCSDRIDFLHKEFTSSGVFENAASRQCESREWKTESRNTSQSASGYSSFRFRESFENAPHASAQVV